jgi:beta-glucosidase
MPETIAVDTPHIPAHLYFPGTRHTVEYREGLDVGYRYFNKRHDSSTSDPDVVRFPFGHGLQYATFEYRNLKVAIQTDSKAKKRVVVSVDVQNTGTSHGAKEVIQLYVRAIGSAVYRPAHELKGFEKVYFSPGETKTVKFDLDERAFAFYDIGWKDWVVEHGLKCSFEIQIGTSSRDIRLRQTISFTSGQDASLLAQQSYPPVNDKSHQKVGGEYYVDDTTFSKRFGSSKLSVLDIISRTNEENVHEKIVHRNTLLKEASNVSWLGWVLFQFTYVMAISEVRRGPRRKREIRMIRANVENLPLRVLVLFAKGALTFRILDSLILLMNGFYLAALRSLFKRDRNYVRCLGQ